MFSSNNQIYLYAKGYIRRGQDIQEAKELVLQRGDDEHLVEHTKGLLDHPERQRGVGQKASEDAVHTLATGDNLNVRCGLRDNSGEEAQNRNQKVN